MTPLPGDVSLAKFPLGGTVRVEVRPVLILTGPLVNVPEYVVAFRTSVGEGVSLPTDFVIDPTTTDFAGTNLKQVTVLRLHKISTVHSRDIIRRLGAIDPPTLAAVRVLLRSALELT